MELKEIYKFFYKFKKTLLLLSLLGAIIGVAVYYFLPVKYIASGSIFVGRAISPELANEFTYEGYYGQQSAIAYTNSVIGLVESEDIRAIALKENNQELSEANLRKLARKIKTKKVGPQLFTLEIKDVSQTNAQELWKTIATNTMLTAQKINKDADPLINLTLVSEEPIIKHAYKNVGVNILAGAFMGFLMSALYFTLKEYLK